MEDNTKLLIEILTSNLTTERAKLNYMESNIPVFVNGDQGRMWQGLTNAQRTVVNSLEDQIEEFKNPKLA